MSELRCARINQVLKERLSEIFIRYLRDEIGFTTITDVKVTPDLRNATVYYSVIGSDEEKRKTAKSLENSRSFINVEMGKNLHIKYTPVIKFEYDDTQEKASRVFELLNKIEEEKIVESSEKIHKPSRRPKKRSKKSKK
ncbi:MAG TPA: 30S ribosome-binding factor RbfA [Elusimicrobia bacterium]|nr:30S ribosome-binding factor RbfA [Elusimicrobiota bacterium]